MVPHGDFETLTEQLGREPTIRFDVIVRCPAGHPLVIRNHPLDPDGEPFPTLYWLTCPDAVKAVARIESSGAIRELNARADADPEFALLLEDEHEANARERGRWLTGAEEWGGVGGTRKGVKCLHAHYANHLAGGEDVVGSWVAGIVEPIHGESIGERVAAIDQGTNSIRLLVVGSGEQAAGGMRELARDMVITRLGMDVDRTGRLDPAALARTLDVLERYCRRARALHTRRIHMTASSAVRDASNREELAAAVLRLTGEELEVISGEREAALSFVGALEGLHAPRPLLVLDIGGGSTEFAIGDLHPEASLSVQMGSVRLTERFLDRDPPAAEELTAAREEIARVLNEVDAALPVDEVRTLVAVAGTATTVQAISLGLARYDPGAIHRSVLTLDGAEEVLGRLTRMTNEERGALPVMAPGRQDVIVAGAEILVAVMSRWGFDEALVSETDILDGLAAETLANR